MTGSLQIRRDNYFAVLNFKDHDGKRTPKWIPLHIVAKGNKRQATALLAQLLAEHDGKETLSPVGKMPIFTDYLLNWLELEKGRIEKSTWESYNSYTHRHIIPYFELLNLRADKVTATHITKSRQKMLAKGTGKHVFAMTN